MPHNPIRPSENTASAQPAHRTRPVFPYNADPFQTASTRLVSNRNERDPSMITTNIETVPGRTIARHIGLVQGSTVRAKHVGRDIMAGLKNIVGGELKGYTELLNEARDEALRRMAEQARRAGANAVVNVRFSTASVAAGAAEILAYGTAVVLED
ncbi:TPA: YbjQ family protein [Neisseria bacilliformis]